MGILNLQHPGTRAALAHPLLMGKQRIGRGWFCAVFDNGDSVLKLTCDATQYAFYTDSLRPQGKCYPKLIENHGQVGHMKGLDLYLVEMEKLTPFGKKHQTPAQAWNQRREFIRVVEHHRLQLWDAYKYVSSLSYDVQLSAGFLCDASMNERLDADMQQAAYELSMFCISHKCRADLHCRNFMLRGDQIVLNDVVTAAGVE